MDLFKLLAFILLLGIIGSLGSALVYLFRDQDDSRRTVRALTIRISLSVAFFVLLLTAYALGYVQPNSVGG
jgi:hypothetical protein